MHHGRKHSASAKLIRVNSVDSQANTENAGSGTFAARTMPAIGSLESYGPSASRPKHGTRVPPRRCSPTRSLLRVTHVRIGVLNCSLYCNPPTISIETYIDAHRRSGRGCSTRARAVRRRRTAHRPETSSAASKLCPEASVVLGFGSWNNCQVSCTFCAAAHDSQDSQCTVFGGRKHVALGGGCAGHCRGPDR